MRKLIAFLALLGAIVVGILAERTFKRDAAFGQIANKNSSATIDAQAELPETHFQLSAKEKLGMAMFFDKNLSNPPGLSCAGCHAPEAGYAGSSNSQNNALYGVGVGAVKGRFENRNPPTITYSKFCPYGPPVFSRELQSYVGGLFRDGRVPNLPDQVKFPFFHPNEMNNQIENSPAPQMVVESVRKAPYADQFKQVFGGEALNQPTEKIFQMISDAIAAFEFSVEVSPFTSKYDAFIAHKAQLTPSEFSGLELVTGLKGGIPGGPFHKSGQCVICHGIKDDPQRGESLFTRYCFTNIGVPKNPNNPYYAEIDKVSNPLGCNRLGSEYVDLGLGDCLYPSMGLPPGNIGPGSDGQGDHLLVNGTFKVPTLRNVDKRPNSMFVKAYMHNGCFKSLKDVVHFYNTRNLTSYPKEVIDFTKPKPYADLKGKPIWPPPECSDTMVNPSGAAGQIGNLMLTEAEENDIVAFLKTLSDGYFTH